MEILKWILHSEIATQKKENILENKETIKEKERNMEKKN